MKMFTKLALVSSMAISANAMAMQSMDDAALSAATGQDGINIGIGISKVEIDKVLIHDNDGYKYGVGGAPATAPAAGTIGAGGTGVAGAIVVNNISITPNTDNSGAELLASHNLADLTIDTDAGTGATGGAFLNVAAKVSGLNISLGKIEVAASGTAGTTGIQRGTTGTSNEILSGLSIKTGKMDANIQLGAAPQGAMIKLNTTLASGLEITNLGIKDKSTIGQLTSTGVASTLAGEIHLDSIKVADSGQAGLTVNTDISVVGESAAAANDGYLRIISKAPAAGTDVYIKGVHLGSATAGSIGDVEVQGLKTYYGAAGTSPGAVITISGH
ncbi:putative pilus system protein FilA [Acinetobacter proteolyticus]|uniref:putative pilus system protein FilA n=1 Tax=Acinetobacter proteolyticus TaxID=1776741 RepID=UPI0031DF7576